MSTLRNEREQAIHLRRAGITTGEVAAALNRSEQWVRKWWRRYQNDGWAALSGQSHAPHRHGNRLPDHVRQQVLSARSELEAKAARGEGLRHVGARAVRSQLRKRRCKPLPSVPSIERFLHQAGMTHPFCKEEEPEIAYPHLAPTQPHDLCQVDIVPHWLGPGKPMVCFNAIDTVSRYPTGQAYAQRRSTDAATFLIHVWQTLGIPHYTQVDNEACFSGGPSHPHVLGKVVRLALAVGTELVFSPVYHPKSNKWVERFHQEYNRCVWRDTHLTGREDVQAHTDTFMQEYREADHLKALKDRTPDEVHHQQPPTLLDQSFSLPETKMPLYQGRIHFMRAVQTDGTVRVLNVDWHVPGRAPETGVWVTITFEEDGAILTIYDLAPDAQQRCCLATYPFPLSEKVYPCQTTHESGAVSIAETVTKTADREMPVVLRSSSQVETTPAWMNLSFTVVAVGLELAQFARNPSRYFR